MKISDLFAALRRMGLLALALVLAISLAVPAYASETKNPFKKGTTSHKDVEFTYELFLTDQNGLTVENPRKIGRAHV